MSSNNNKEMKTLIIWDEIEELPKYVLVDGDLRRYNQVYINGCEDNEELQDELSQLFYKEDGSKTELNERLQPFDGNQLPGHDYCIICGFLP